LGQPVYLPPGQARQERVRVEQGNPVQSNPTKIGVVVQAEEMLAGKFCDFQECLWRGNAEFNMWLNNWGTEPLTVPRDEADWNNRVGDCSSTG